ncbi:hypothetical protein [Rahnella ecdela]|uniref:SMODS and SLOG-associating 2TM effector domain-containing protein n=1 Tax=Rahnella ecdela TaxID=2816250 RepID=A0ABS6LJP2_9GAMM|nr:hypothetical protein [Rahnella ecdela]MBU9847158.1 hypothetical protein [Rahnella ecdela]
MAFFNIEFIPQYIKILLFLAVVWIIWVRVPDISFFIRIFTKIFRLNFTDARFIKYDNDLHNLHLFKLIHGINVSSLDDALIVNNALKDKIIKRKLLWFSGYFGEVGVKRELRGDTFFTSLIAFVFIIFSLGMLLSLSSFKYGYASYADANTPKLLISTYNILDTGNQKTYNKKACTTLKENESQYIKDACNYLTTSDVDLKEELKHYISKEERDLKIAIAFIITFLVSGFVLLIGARNFYKLNNIVCDLKERSED